MQEAPSLMLGNIRFAGRAVANAVVVGPRLILAPPLGEDIRLEDLYFALGAEGRIPLGSRLSTQPQEFALYSLNIPAGDYFGLPGVGVVALPDESRAVVLWREGDSLAVMRADANVLLDNRGEYMAELTNDSADLRGAVVMINNGFGGLLTRISPRTTAIDRGRQRQFWEVQRVTELFSAWDQDLASQGPDVSLFWRVRTAETQTNAPPPQVNKRAQQKKMPEPAQETQSDELKFSTGARRVLLWAASMARTEEQTVSPQLLLAALLVFGQASERRDSARFMYRILFEERASGPRPQLLTTFTPPLDDDEPPEKWLKLDTAAGAWVADAMEAAVASDSGGRTGLRHIVAALLLSARAKEHATKAGLLPQFETDWQEMVDRFPAHVQEISDEGSKAAWPQWIEAQKSRQASAAVAAAARRFGRTGYDADSPQGVDHLDIEDEVATLCSVMLDANHPPPLSIGLFGDWGSGKSFFIRKMQDRIKDMTQASRLAAEQKQPTAFVKHAPQIEFNAWHYIDANLWASLVTHLLQELRLQLFGTTTEEQARAELDKRLYGELQTTQKRLEDLEREKKLADGRVTEAQNRQRAAADRLQSGEMGFAAALSATDPQLLKELVFQRGEVQAKAKQLADELGHVDASTDELERLVTEVLDEMGKWRQFYRDNKLVCWIVFLAVALAGVLSIPAVAAAFSGMLDRAIQTVKWVAAPLAAFVAYVARLRPYLNRARELRRTAERVQTSILEEQRQKVTRAELDAQTATERLATEQRRAQELQARIEEARRGIGLDGFLQERLGSSRYTEQLGIVALARNDFDKLKDRLSVGKDANGVDQKVDRVILYIDDLDRCPPDRVVEVLQAVHLLLAVPLFVVVVAADPRWLLHSLRRHYADLLATDNDDDGDTETRRQDSQWDSTPQQYLEKIFQIPYTLAPMEDGGFRKLVKSLLANKAADVRVTAAAAGNAPNIEREPPNAASPHDAPGQSLPLRVAAAQASTPSSTVAPLQPASPATRDPSAPAAAPSRDSDTSRVSGVDEDAGGPPINLAPDYLDLTDGEKGFLEELAALVRTPRSTKRLVNVYRLLRANLKEERVTRLKNGEYVAVQLLLGIMVGFPEEAPELFMRLRQATGKEPLWSDNVLGKHVKGALSQTGWDEMVKAIDTLEDNLTAKQRALPFVDWLDEVVRYSFRSGRVIGEMPDRGGTRPRAAKS